MSALGQKQTFRSAIVMSALPPKADVCRARQTRPLIASGVAFVPAMSALLRWLLHLRGLAVLDRHNLVARLLRDVCQCGFPGKTFGSALIASGRDCASRHEVLRAEKRAALDAWANHIRVILAANVTAATAKRTMTMRVLISTT